MKRDRASRPSSAMSVSYRKEELIEELISRERMRAFRPLMSFVWARKVYKIKELDNYKVFDNKMMRSNRVSSHVKCREKVGNSKKREKSGRYSPSFSEGLTVKKE